MKKFNFVKYLNNIYEKIGDYYKKAQEFLSPKGSYIIATMPFIFFYKYLCENIRISEKLLILLIVMIVAILNAFKPKLISIPVAILMLFSILERNMIVALFAFILVLFAAVPNSMVKKGKFQTPLLIMIFTAGCVLSPVYFIVAIMFMCSIMWIDNLNIFITPFAVLVNLLIYATATVTFNTVFKQIALPSTTLTLGKYINTVLNNTKNFSWHFNNFCLLWKEYYVFYITIIIGFIVFAKLFYIFFIRSAKKRSTLSNILIPHIFAGFSILIIYQLAHYLYATNTIINILNSNGSKYNAFESIDNFIGIYPAVKDYFVNNQIYMLHVKDVIIALLITIPISVFVNGYDFQKSFLSKNNSEVFSYGDNKISWDDIAGYESTKQEIKDAILPYTDIKLKKKLNDAHMDLPKGILLFGPPGCGKTMFAKAISNESHMNFLSVKGNEFTSKWVGESEKNLREIFESAKKQAPCVIFFDEIEAFLSKREEVDEHNRSLVTTFLAELDGFVKDDRFFVVGATNNPDMLDQAAIRPGRFDKCIYIDTPNNNAREEIIKKYLHGKCIYDVEQLKSLVNITKRYSGADIRGVIEETFRKNKFNSFDIELLNDMLSHYKPTMDYEMQRKYKKLQAKYNRSTYSQEDIGITNRPKVTWQDTAGLEDIKDQIKEIIEKPLKYSKKYKELGISYSKGILMYGPPGCGKTLISKIIASQYNLYFIPVNGPEFLSKNTGESEEQIRKLFMEAKDNAPSIIFFDEFDSIAENRELQAGKTKIVNQLLTEMDGNEALEGVIVIGATNRIETIDPALKRPGRFDKLLYIGLPNNEARTAQFKLHLKKLPEKYNYKKFADLTDKFTCADIEMCCKSIMLKELDFSIDNDDKHITENEIVKIIKNFNHSLSDKEIKHYEETAKLTRT